MIMDFNKQQTDALETKIDQNVLISAGAGSGKTRVLTEKVYKVIHDDGVSPSSLLVLTFTNKAAFEMKDRIIKKFEESGSGEDSLIDEIQSAHIQTFDSFSLYLVKKYAKNLNIPSAVNIINEDIFKIKKNEFLDEIFLEHYRNKDEAFLKTMEKFNFRKDEKTREVVLDLDNRLSNLPPASRNEFIENCQTKYLDEDFVHQSFKNYVESFKKDLRISLKQAYYADMYYDEYSSDPESFIQMLASNSGIDASENYLSFGLDDECTKSSPVYSDLVSLLSIDDPEEFIDAVKKINKTYNKKSAKEGKDKDIYETYLKEYVNKSKSKFTPLYKINEQDLESEYEKISSFKEDIKVLFSLCDELDKKLEEYKLRTNSYTFSDIALKALSLMIDEKYKDVAEEVKDRFTYIMVDEYQDTNDIQEAFLNAISERATLFVVGDVKQSIYAFRNANCQLILDREGNYAKAEDGKHKVVHMNTNYRSVEKMLSDINLIFTNFMSENHGGVNYDENQWLEYDGKADLYKNLSEKSDYGVNVINIVDDYGLSPDEAQALAIAKDIKHKIESGYLVNDRGKLRPCTYKDFAVISRRKKSFGTYAETFDGYGIPYNLHEKEGFTDMDVISVIQSLLSLMSSISRETKENERHLFASVARSYIFGKDAGYDDQKIYDLLNDTKTNPYRQDPLYLKIKAFTYENINKPISKIFLNLLEEFEIVKKLPAIGNIESNITSIESMYSMILSEETLGDGVSDFISLLKSVDKYSLSIEAESETSLDDAVEIITIHGSKGLEYKIVYMPAYDNTLSKSGGNSGKPDYTFSKEYGLILPDYRITETNGTYDMAVRHGLLKTFYDKTEGSKDEDINEFVRFLYVALTRAKECCYIIGRHGNSYYHITLDDMLSSAGYLNRLCEWVPKEYPETKSLAAQINELNAEIEEDTKIASEITSPFALNMYKTRFYDRKQKEVANLIKEVEKVLNDIWKANPDDPNAHRTINRKEYCHFGSRDISLKEVTAEMKTAVTKLPSFKTDETEIEAKPFEKRRASKMTDEDEEPDQYVLDLGTRMHRYMELTDLRTKDTSFIENEKERKIIDKALQAPFFEDLDGTETYSEYGYRDDEFKTAGYIDLLLVKPDEIVIIDYKLKHIDDEAYTDQLHTYKRNIEKIFGTERPVNCYLLALTTGEYSKVE